MALDEASCTTLTNTFRVVGEWLETEKETSLGTMKARKCSICGESHVGKVEYGSRYCPDCGNIMKNSADWDEVEVFEYIEESTNFYREEFKVVNRERRESESI